eukprot:211778_1
MSTSLYTLVIVCIYTIENVVSGPTTCDNATVAYGCVGTDFDNRDFQSCGAYKSCYGPTTSYRSSGGACRGQSSCAQIASYESLLSYVGCDGGLSCINTTISGKVIQQRGAFSATFTTITYDPNYSGPYNGWLTCNALQSCAHALVQQMPQFSGYAAYSFYKATFSTHNFVNITDYTMDLYGAYSAYGATMTCMGTHTCTVNCYSYTACLNFYINCLGHCTFNTFFFGQNTIPPTTNYSLFDPIASIPSVYDRLMDNEVLCSTSPTAFLADNSKTYYQAESISVTNDGPICCRGKQACMGIRTPGIEYDPSITGKSVVCSGWRSCQNSKIYTNNGHVFCDAREACTKAKVYTADAVYCFGEESCTDTLFEDVHNIYCAGKRSCYSATKTVAFTSGGNDLNLTLTGWEAAKDGVVYCNATDVCTIGCKGYQTCVNLGVHCHGICNVECNTWSACPWILTFNPSSQPIQPTEAPLLILTPTRKGGEAEANDIETTIEIWSTQLDDAMDAKLSSLLPIALIILGVCMAVCSLICCIGIQRILSNKKTEERIDNQNAIRHHEVILGKSEGANDNSQNMIAIDHVVRNGNEPGQASQDDNSSSKADNFDDVFVPVEEGENSKSHQDGKYYKHINFRKLHQQTTNGLLDVSFHGTKDEERNKYQAVIRESIHHDFANAEMDEVVLGDDETDIGSNTPHI